MTRRSDIRETGFYLDALRMSLAIARVAHGRLIASLASIEPIYVDTGSYDESIASAFSDAWTLVDQLHRSREIIQQCRVISKRHTATQMFLRSTSRVEDLRNHVQHFRSGISRLPAISSPIFGCLAWVSEVEPKRCYAIWSGSLLAGVQTHGCTYDQVEQKFVQRLLLVAGNQDLDLGDSVDSLFSYAEKLPAIILDHAAVLSAPLGLAYSFHVRRDSA
jgi:hypothetical protein